MGVTQSWAIEFYPRGEGVSPKRHLGSGRIRLYEVSLAPALGVKPVSMLIQERPSI